MSEEQHHDDAEHESGIKTPRDLEGRILGAPVGWFRAIVWDRLREQAPLKEPVTIDEIAT